MQGRGPDTHARRACDHLHTSRPALCSTPALPTPAGATAILAQACGFDFPLCKPGEAAKPPAELVAKAANGGR